MISIVEVGPRDGLQNEDKTLSVSKKVSLVDKLVESGLRRIEIGAFVSPKWVPQMSDSELVAQKVFEKHKRLSKRMSALTPNLIGMDRALKVNFKEVAVFGAASETFCQKNINCTIAESFKRFASVLQLAHKNKLKVRGYLSTAFGCPYEGKVSQAKVIRLVQKLLALGVYEVSIGDTIGVATPLQVESLCKKLRDEGLLQKVAMHFHDTRGTALANVLMSLNFGVLTFDSSIGGLGGCPYAKGASGNLATEDLVYMLHGMKLKTGVDLEKLIQIKPWLERQLSRSLPARVSSAGLPKKGTV